MVPLTKGHECKYKCVTHLYQIEGKDQILQASERKGATILEQLYFQLRFFDSCSGMSMGLLGEPQPGRDRMQGLPA